LVRRWTSLRARSPLMRLRFRHDGTVDQVTVLESTGYRQVDQDFIDSLYEWTATGAQIEALTESQTLPFIVRLEPI
jgi:outer membrane biosynthesis protein TonB